MEGKTAIKIIIFIGILVGAYALLTKKTIDIPKDAIYVKAEDVITSYEQNGEEQAEKLKGKKLAIVGTVEEVGKEERGRDYVILRGDHITPTLQIQCYLDPKKGGKMSQGDVVTVVGVCEGFSGNIILVDSYKAPIKRTFFNSNDFKRANYDGFNKMLENN